MAVQTADVAGKAISLFELWLGAFVEDAAAARAARIAIFCR
jgi:hypothetical protein